MKTEKKYAVVRFRPEGEYFVTDKFISWHREEKDALAALDKFNKDTHGVECYLFYTDKWGIPCAKQDFNYLINDI